MYLQIKLTGGIAGLTVLTCSLVTVTTTMLHMSKLSALNECAYQATTRTCTCYPVGKDTLTKDQVVGSEFPLNIYL